MNCSEISTLHLPLNLPLFHPLPDYNDYRQGKDLFAAHNTKDNVSLWGKVWAGFLAAS